VSAESPTAWASFATGVNPGKHNIYDFLIRDTSKYVIDLGMVKKTPPTFLWHWLPTSRPKIETLRGGTSFWVSAGATGVRSSVLTVRSPSRRKTSPMASCCPACRCPTCAARLDSFRTYATDVSRYEEGNTEFGGTIKRSGVRRQHCERPSPGRTAESDRQAAQISDLEERHKAGVRWPIADRRARRVADARGSEAAAPVDLDARQRPGAVTIERADRRSRPASGASG
jgi:hypothetical protein